jgi:hypothetical protein
MHRNVTMSHGFDDSGRFAFFVASPDGGYEEWESAMEAIFADSRHTPGVGLLADHRAQRSILRQGIVRRMTFLERHRERLAGGRCAVVATPGFHFGMARMAEVLTQGSPFVFVAFDDVDAARAWLLGR